MDNLVKSDEFMVAISGMVRCESGLSVHAPESELRRSLFKSGPPMTPGKFIPSVRIQTWSSEPIKKRVRHTIATQAFGTVEIPFTIFGAIKFSHHFLFALLFLITTALSAQTKMTPAEANALKTAVRQQAESTKTITSDFTQYKHLDFLSNDIESQGKLAFKAPDLVKWQYVEPFSYSIIFKDGTLFINDDGNKSNLDVGGNKIFTQLNQLITASIRGDLFDDSQFDISYFMENGGSLVKFIPKDTQFAEFIKAFHLTFNTAGEVIEVKMIEPSDDYTHILFSDRKTNQPLSDADFVP